MTEHTAHTDAPTAVQSAGYGSGLEAFIDGDFGFDDAEPAACGHVVTYVPKYLLTAAQEEVERLREERKTWPYCPLCGRARLDRVTDEPKCSPTTDCPAWKRTATFNHTTREWEPAEQYDSQEADRG